MRHVSMLINAYTLNAGGTATDRACGFSDSWYDSGDETQVMTDADRQLVNRRAALLPDSASIVGFRISLLDEFGKSKGRSRVYKTSVGGGQGTQPNDPRMALKYTLFGNGVTNELQYYLQNIPTARIANGSYNPSQSFEDQVKVYFDFVYNNGYRFFGFNQALDVAPILKIEINEDPEILTGTVTLERNNVWAPGNTVRVIDSRTDLRGHFRQKPSGYQVLTSAGLVLTLANWDQGACTGGRMTTWAKVLCQPFLDDRGKQSPLVCTRKVGRPFFQYRGRTSSRA